MDDKVLNDIEIAPSFPVKRAASGFATLLSESPEFKTFQQAADRFRQDQVAQQALGDYKQKAFSWRDLTMLNALTDESPRELENLQSAFVNEPVVQEYFKAQMEVATLCHAIGERLSESIGLNYAAACGVSYWAPNAVMQMVLSPQLLEATQSLIDHLLAAQTLMRYHQARNRINQDSEVRIADVMYTLKSMASTRSCTPILLLRISRKPLWMVKTFGRSYVMRLASRHYLRNFPLRLLGMMPMGFSMITKGRMAIMPKRIKSMDQLKKIMTRAKELELTS